jgi:uncharacterized MAPEG superfamily protein
VTVEQRLLALSILLGLVNNIAASHLISAQYGYAWTASTREKEMPPLTGVAARVDAAFTNFIETFPFFAAAILMASILNRHTALTVWGAYLYLTGRVAYLLFAATGYGLLRSLIWNVATIGILALVIALFV